MLRRLLKYTKIDGEIIENEAMSLVRMRAVDLLSDRPSRRNPTKNSMIKLNKKSYIHT